jgi:hypothetical protein
MDTVGIRAPTRQIREFYTFSMRSALRNSPSAGRVIAANEIYRFLDFLVKTLSLLRTPSQYQKVFR